MKVNGLTATNLYFIKNRSSNNASQTKSYKSGDKLEISNTARVYDKIDNFLNLHSSDWTDVSDLNPEEQKEFFKMMNALIKKGIVGYEYLEVNGKKEKHFLTNEIGDERIYGARKWKDKYKFTPKPRR